jgi:HEAT repeat protein
VGSAAALPADPQLVVDAFRYFDKVMRAHQLYLANNPAYVRSLDAARAGFRALFGQVDAVELTVTETALLWHGVVVHEMPQIAGDSLPWLLYKDGVREFALYRGFEGAELIGLLRCLAAARRATAEQDDLLTLMWEQDFEFVRYEYIETFDQTPPLVPGEEPGVWGVRPDGAPTVADALRIAQEGRAPAHQVRRPSTMIRVADAEGGPYAFLPAEMEYLRSEATREQSLDLRRAVLGSLFDIFEEQTDPTVRAEAVEAIESLCVHFIDRGHFNSVAYAVREVLLVLDRAPDLAEGDRRTLGQLAERMSRQETLARMLNVLEDAEVLPSEDDLVDLFGYLKVGAIATLLDFTARTHNSTLRTTVAAVIERLAISHTADLVRLVVDPRPSVAIEAARLAGRLGVTAAVAPLAGVVQSMAEQEVRLAALAALTTIGSADAIAALEPLIADPVRELRVPAIKTLTARRVVSVRPRVAALIKGKTIREMDRSERLALFELFGSVCGDGGVPDLEAMLTTSGGLFSRGGDTELRAAAAIALGQVGTPTARRVLEGYASDKDPVVKAAVARSLRARIVDTGSGA